MKALLNWRYYILMAVGCVAMLGIFSEPYPDSPTWYSDMFWSKIIGFGAGYLWYKLQCYWEARNKIPELINFINEDEEE